jgi:hypothetical protein
MLQRVESLDFSNVESVHGQWNSLKKSTSELESFTAILIFSTKSFVKDFKKTQILFGVRYLALIRIVGQDKAAEFQYQAFEAMNERMKTETVEYHSVRKFLRSNHKEKQLITTLPFIRFIVETLSDSNDKVGAWGDNAIKLCEWLDSNLTESSTIRQHHISDFVKEFETNKIDFADLNRRMKASIKYQVDVLRRITTSLNNDKRTWNDCIFTNQLVHEAMSNPPNQSYLRPPLPALPPVLAASSDCATLPSNSQIIGASKAPTLFAPEIVVGPSLRQLSNSYGGFNQTPIVRGQNNQTSNSYGGFNQTPIVRGQNNQTTVVALLAHTPVTTRNCAPAEREKKFAQLASRAQVIGSYLERSSVRCKAEWYVDECVTMCGTIATEPTSFQSLYLENGKFLNVNLDNNESTMLSILNNCRRSRNLIKCNLRVIIEDNSIGLAVVIRDIHIGQQLVMFENAPDEVIQLRLCLSCLKQLSIVDCFHQTIINKAIHYAGRYLSMDKLQTGFLNLNSDKSVVELLTSVIALVHGVNLPLTERKLSDFPAYHFQFSVWSEVFQYNKFINSPAEFLFEDDYRETVRLWRHSANDVLKSVTDASDISYSSFGNSVEYILNGTTD